MVGVTDSLGDGEMDRLGVTDRVAVVERVGVGGRLPDRLGEGVSEPGMLLEGLGDGDCDGTT